MENDTFVIMKDTISLLMSKLEPIYGKGEAKAMIRLIFHNIKGWSPTDMIIHEDDILSDYIKDKINVIIQRLEKHEPIQYILGETVFYGLRMMVGPGVLIPRPETEELVDIIVKENQQPDLRVLDLCTGSGAIALALARNLPFSKVDGMDISVEALRYASQNNEALRAHVKFIRADLFSFISDKTWDIIVSNPPYVTPKEKDEMEKNVLDYEPMQALFVPEDHPLLYYEKIIEFAESHLNEGGRLYMEINPMYASQLLELVHKSGFVDVRDIRDMYGKLRFIKAEMPHV